MDLTARYLGLDLRSPIVASASPLTGEALTAMALARAGAGAIVLPSLFEEEVLREELDLGRALEAGAEHFAEALDYFPSVPEIATAGDRYVARLGAVKAAVDVPVIASLNATSSGSWVRYAYLLAEAGADALELNVYRIAADASVTGADVETEVLGVVADVRAAVRIPLAVKLSPYFSALANVARRLVDAGADGLVLFNRFYQPDLDLDVMDVVPRLELSTPWELRLPLRWLAILRPQLGADVSLAATSGVHSGSDALKAIATGADVAMMTSSVLRHGPGHIAKVLSEMRAWLEEHEYESVDQLRGSMSHATTADPTAYERANYFKVLHSWTTPTNLVASSPR